MLIVAEIKIPAKAEFNLFFPPSLCGRRPHGWLSKAAGGEAGSQLHGAAAEQRQLMPFRVDLDGAVVEPGAPADGPGLYPLLFFSAFGATNSCHRPPPC